MQVWMKGALALALSVAFGCAPGTGTPDGSDGGAVDGTDAGGDPASVARRSFNASGTVSATTSLSFSPPPCEGACPVEPTTTYPDGDTLTQWAQLADPVSGDLYFSVTRLRRDDRNGAPSDVREFLAFRFPRDASGTVSCGGTSAAGHIYVGEPNSPLDTATPLFTATCAFDVLENSATQVRVELKSELVVPLGPGVPGGWTIGAGVISIPAKAYTALPSRAHAGTPSIVAQMGDGTIVNGSQNPRVFVSGRQLAASGVGAVAGLGDGSLDVSVPTESLGFVSCNNVGAGSVSVAFTTGEGRVAFSSSRATGTCTLLVLRNDPTHFNVVNVGQLPLPIAVDGEGEVAIIKLNVDADLQ